jgi:hypothetical protein
MVNSFAGICEGRISHGPRHSDQREESAFSPHSRFSIPSARPLSPRNIIPNAEGGGTCSAAATREPQSLRSDSDRVQNDEGVSGIVSNTIYQLFRSRVHQRSSAASAFRFSDDGDVGDPGDSLSRAPPARSRTHTPAPAPPPQPRLSSSPDICGPLRRLSP